MQHGAEGEVGKDARMEQQYIIICGCEQEKDEVKGKGKELNVRECKMVCNAGEFDHREVGVAGIWYLNAEC